MFAKIEDQQGVRNLEEIVQVAGTATRNIIAATAVELAESLNAKGIVVVTRPASWPTTSRKPRQRAAH